MRWSSARFVPLLVLVSLLLVPGRVLAGDGATLYEANCVTCHGPDGRADTAVGKAMKAVSLVDPKWKEDGAAEAMVAAFRANPKHKPVASKVSDDDLRAIAVYVRKLASAE